jgi:peptide/nickel transport system permease protein
MHALSLRSPAVRLVAAKLGQVLFVLVAVSALTFFLLNAVPGNEVAVRIGPLPNFTPAARAEIINTLSRQLGLDKPLVVQYGIWLVHAIQGNFGPTIQGDSAFSVVISRAGASLELAVAGLVPSALAALALATWALRTRRRRLRAVVEALMSTLYVIPSFWLGFLLVLAFAVKLSILPASGYQAFSVSPGTNLLDLVLPAATLFCPLTALFFRYLLAGLEEAAGGAFVIAARAKGISERAIAYRHVLPNGVLPTITIFGMAAASLLSSLVIVESVFSWPGLGLLIVQSVDQHDYNTLVCIVLLTAVAFVVTSLLVDIVYWVLDPRTRRPAAA